MNPTKPIIESSSFRYYCYNCGIQVRVTDSYKCVICSRGFVEEIATWNSDRISARRTIPARSSNIENENNDIDNEPSDSYESLASTSSMPNETEQADATTPRPTQQPQNSIGTALMHGVLDVVDIFRGGRNDAPTQSGASTSRPAMNEEQLRDRVHNLLYALGEERRRNNTNRNSQGATNSNQRGGGGGGGGGGGVGGGGQQAASDLENSLMRTLRMLFSASLRPMSDQRLDQIPKVSLNAEDLANHPRCSICWEEFKQDESVRKLPCSHLHHENCIFPWLAMHRTCPLCRYHLNDDVEFEDLNPQESQNINETPSFESARERVENIGSELPGDTDNSTEN